jgi:hypothetical protein
MRNIKIIILVLPFLLISIKMAQAADCSSYIKMVKVAVEQLPAENDVEINCGISKESCGRFIDLSRESIALSRRGIKMIKAQASCQGYPDLDNILKKFEEDTARIEKVIDRYEVRLKQ